MRSEKVAGLLQSMLFSKVHILAEVQSKDLIRCITAQLRRTKFPLPPDRILNELLQVHLLLPQGSKRRATLHQTFGADIQLDLPHNRPDAPTHMVLELAFIFHEV